MAVQYQPETKSREQIAAEALRLVPTDGSASPVQNYAQLPPVAASPQAQAPAPGQSSQNPVDKFNLALMQLLTGAQGMNNDPTLLNERNRLGVQQINNSMAPASDLGIQNLDPNAALNARQNAGQLYNPEINNLTDRIKASADAVSNFQNALDTAKSFGENYAKSVQVDDATIEAVKHQMAAGFLPSADVIAKLGKYLTADDWNALSKAKAAGADGGSSPTSIQEYNLAKSEGFTGTFQQWTDRTSQYKPTSGDGIGSSGDSKQFTRVKAIVAAHPNEWGHAADQIDAEFGAGTATKYDDYLKSVYGFSA